MKIRVLGIHLTGVRYLPPHELRRSSLQAGLVPACPFTIIATSNNFRLGKMIYELFAATWEEKVSRPSLSAWHHPLSGITGGLEKPHWHWVFDRIVRSQIAAGLMG